MSAVPDDIRHLFPWQVRPSGDVPRPRVLNVVGNPEDEGAKDDVPDDAAPATGDALARRLSPSRASDWDSLREPPEDERPIVQEVAEREERGATAHGRAGCVSGLKRSLSALCGGKWTNPRLIKRMDESGLPPAYVSTDAAARQLVRLEAGDERIGAGLVVQIARTFGVELDELVFTHEVYGRKDSVGRSNPIDALEEERDARLREALRRYEVTLAPLGDEESYRKLATDIANPAAERELRHPWQTAGSTAPRDRWPEALRRLEDSLSDQAAELDRLAVDLRKAVGDLGRAGYRAAFGRHICVVDPPERSFLPRPGDPMRRTTVVVSPERGDTRVHVDLLPSWHRRPTWREELLREGDLSVVPEIREDIAWCGHWEGRWFRFLPLDVPDWLRQAVERHAAA